MESASGVEDRLAIHLDQRLADAVCALTAHLESFVERLVHESHDGIAARIEDVTAAYVDQARSTMVRTGSVCKSDGPEIAKELKVLKEESMVLRQRHEALEALVTQLAEIIAREKAAVQADVEERRLSEGQFNQVSKNKLQLATQPLQSEFELRGKTPQDFPEETQLAELRTWVSTEADSVRFAIPRSEAEGITPRVVASLPGSRTSTPPAKSADVWGTGHVGFLDVVDCGNAGANSSDGSGAVPQQEQQSASVIDGGTSEGNFATHCGTSEAQLFCAQSTLEPPQTQFGGGNATTSSGALHSSEDMSIGQGRVASMAYSDVRGGAVACSTLLGDSGGDAADSRWRDCHVTAGTFSSLPPPRLDTALETDSVAMSQMSPRFLNCSPARGVADGSGAVLHKTNCNTATGIGGA
eukprot:TRINITY_DN36450_c0_g1_i1.p1 TRINITY_DN36450_c0_g1~~TRINITY_DN36450_c0_g1_i1.p1  ORF type:complete len:412 (+),score=78.99 TRINITY_DN36450_c0_g1_i1:64-1299(+)